MQRNLEENRLQATTDLAQAVRDSEVIFICVGTPPTESGEPDLKYVDAVAAEIGRALNGYKIVVNKSTVPVGTGDRVRRIIEQHRTEPHEFDVVSNPEFLREGSAIHDTLNPDRIVIGADNPRAAMKIVELYAPLERPMLITNLATAEIIKYASNAFLALKISYINAIADLCERTGADVVQVAKAMGYDQRIGHAFLQAGLGFGGSCFPKDVQAFAHTVQRYQLDSTLKMRALCGRFRRSAPSRRDCPAQPRTAQEPAAAGLCIAAAGGQRRRAVGERSRTADRCACAPAIAKPLPHGRQRARQRNHRAVLDKDARKPLQQGRHLRRADGDHARHPPLPQRVEQVRGFWGEALVDALRGEGCSCDGGGLCPIGVGGTGIAGSTEDHHSGEGAACEFALALDEAGFACAGVGVVLEDLSERVLDVRCEVGCVVHSAWSVPCSGVF